MFVPFLVHGVFRFFGLIRSSFRVQNVRKRSTAVFNDVGLGSAYAKHRATSVRGQKEPPRRLLGNVLAVARCGALLIRRLSPRPVVEGLVPAPTPRRR